MASDFADPSTFLADTVPIGGASVIPQGFNSQSHAVADSVDNDSNFYIDVEISDALSNKDLVSFTIRTKVSHRCDKYFICSNGIFISSYIHHISLID